jgi:hypothetical protein
LFVGVVGCGCGCGWDEIGVMFVDGVIGEMTVFVLIVYIVFMGGESNKAFFVSIYFERINRSD